MKKNILKIALVIVPTFFIPFAQPFIVLAQTSPTDCGTYSSEEMNNQTIGRCIEKKFASCDSAFLHNDFLGQYRYDILGKNDDTSGCRVKFTYILSTDEGLTGKSMECTSERQGTILDIQKPDCSGGLLDAFVKIEKRFDEELSKSDITIGGREQQTTTPALKTGYFYKLSFFDDLLKKSEYLKYIPAKIRKTGSTQDIYAYVKPKGGVVFLVKGQEKAFLQEASNPYRKELQTLWLANKTLQGKDVDRDGLPDSIEGYLGTNPKKKDSDGDAFDDRLELINGYDPLSKKKLLNKYQGLEGKIYKQGTMYWYVDLYGSYRYPLINSSDIVRLAEEKISSYVLISATDSIFIDALKKRSK